MDLTVPPPPPLGPARGVVYVLRCVPYPNRGSFKKIVMAYGPEYRCGTEAADTGSGYRHMANLRIHSVDRRFSKHIKSLRKASNCGESGGASVECTILDLSPDGARLRPAGTAEIPGSFVLRLTPSLTIGCEVVYREQSDIGVAFTA